MAVQQRIRRSRGSETHEKGNEGRFFINLLLCAGLVCAFMLVKDVTLPGGTTVAAFVADYIDANIHIDRIAQKFQEVAVPVFGGNIKENTENKNADTATIPDNKTDEVSKTDEVGGGETPLQAQDN